MTVFLPDSPERLHDHLRRSQDSRRKTGGRLCTDTLNEARDELRARFLPEGRAAPILLTGHQPVFYHPGILIKDLLADALASSTNGVGLNLVVDTDETDIVFDYPVPGAVASGGRGVERGRFVVASGDGMLRERALDPAVRSAFVSQLHSLVPRLPELFPAPRAREMAREIERVCQATVGATSVMDPAVRFRESFEAERGVSLRTVYGSELVESKAFAYFSRFVIENGDEFRRCYNDALRDYRVEHGIRNAAQPLPDLEPGELPFWTVRDARRTALRSGDNFAGAPLYPRAITLTLFVRLFVCDLFIHGRGGGRYDQITDRLMAEFFECAGAPFTVASATLTMEPREDYPLTSRSTAEIDRDLRYARFEPTRFLDPDHPLARERLVLIEERARPGADLKRIHDGFVRLNEAARPLVAEVPARLAEERDRALLVEQNRSVFLDRTFPFFFYETAPLFEAVRAYGPARANAATAAR